MVNFVFIKALLVVTMIASKSFADPAIITYKCVDPQNPENQHNVTVLVGGTSGPVDLKISHTIPEWEFQFSGTINSSLDYVADYLTDNRRTFIGDLKTIHIATGRVYPSKVPIRIKQMMIDGEPVVVSGMQDRVNNNIVDLTCTQEDSGKDETH